MGQNSCVVVSAVASQTRSFHLVLVPWVDQEPFCVLLLATVVKMLDY